MNVLGIAVSADLQRRWQRWLAPEVQPFFVESLRPWPKSTAASLSTEVSDTYRAWRIDRSLKTLWLDEATFFEMPRPRRAAFVRAQVENGRGAVPSVRRWSDVLDPCALRLQADGHRFVWWPSLVARNPHGVLSRVITNAPNGAEKHGLPSRHRDVASTTWTGCADVLPDAKRIAGSFPLSSGPNCFGTVMTAAGVANADDDCRVLEPFVAWLSAACRRGGRDDEPGTVLMWRGTKGLPFHAAVTLGDGWALEKASGEWWTPRAVRRVADVIRTSRARGVRLERHTLRGHAEVERLREG